MATIKQEQPGPPPAPNLRAADTRLLVKGMTCSNCARHVGEAARSVAGVRSASVDLEGGLATIQWQPGVAGDSAPVISAIEQAGYEAAKAPEAAGDQGEQRLAGWKLNLWIGLLGTLPLMLGEWVFGWGMARWFHWVAFGLATVVQVFGGAGFYQGAWRQLKRGQSNMDTLVALGSTTAYGYSVWAILSGRGGHLFFLEAAAIITLISMGHWLEARVTVGASGALRKLLDLAPPRARKLGPDGRESEISAQELVPGDLVVIRPGDRVPIDGEITEGATAVDESMLTGESVPADKATRAPVFTGTVNLSGRVVVRVTAIGDQTALARIIEAVQRAQSSRADIQRLGDRVSSVFVPVVVVIAVAAGLWWGMAPESAARAHEVAARFLWPAHPPLGDLAAAFIIASSVLIVSCPCAMGLATPVAIMAGANAAAQNGILVRDGVALEKAGVINAVCFDKTGTLTTGKPAVEVIWLPPDGSENAAEVAAALANHSSHPVSGAIARHGGRETWLPVRNSEEVHGAGVRGTVLWQGKPMVGLLGSTNWLLGSKIDLQAGREFIDHWASQGATVTGLAVEGRLAALFAIRDALKPGAAQVVHELRSQGLEIFLVTGDNRATAAAIAAQVGITAGNVAAEVRPEKKAELVKRLQQEGRRVAFVGDGINDAPAFRQADLGIAVSRASDIAREAADIILLNSEIEAVPASIDLARATLRTIKQNLFWAFVYNAAGIPLAALGFMSPILCAAAMGFSDLMVIGNALRLRRRRFLNVPHR